MVGAICLSESPSSLVELNDIVGVSERKYRPQQFCLVHSSNSMPSSHSMLLSCSEQSALEVMLLSCLLSSLDHGFNQIWNFQMFIFVRSIAFGTSGILVTCQCSTVVKFRNQPKAMAQMGGNGISVGEERYAVVTGANKGIGLEIARQLASAGIIVVLTARDETKGREATSKLNQMGLSNVIFHQLDVLDHVSIQSLAIFIREKFGRLDILINNAGATSRVVDEDALKALNIDPESWYSGKATTISFQEVTRQTYEQAEVCINTNYYGVKRVTEALLPLLQLSHGKARMVNVSSRRGQLKTIPNEHLRNELGNVETLSEEKIDTLLKEVLNILKENSDIELLPSYPISKACLNAYTRVLAKKYPNMLINCVHPGFVDTDLTWHRGTLSAEEGARSPVMLALLPEEGPTGCYFHLTEEAEF
ncbi:hypothetical protein L6164_031401 [Bauhinia variegata]|uniref:Uncharacterized protein n=1 Tax=Bauhinia variegata TaxID=167791 RepID=A0ACB9LFB9_BAUVA|nr:hypothetical protein L6164_031401 [Bauhinia variegata]